MDTKRPRNALDHHETLNDAAKMYAHGFGYELECIVEFEHNKADYLYEIAGLLQNFEDSIAGWPATRQDIREMAFLRNMIYEDIAAVGRMFISLAPKSAKMDDTRLWVGEQTIGTNDKTRPLISQIVSDYAKKRHEIVEPEQDASQPLSEVAIEQYEELLRGIGVTLKGALASAALRDSESSISTGSFASPNEGAPRSKKPRSRR